MAPQYDTRDPQEHADVAAVLEELAAEHPAHEAYARGTGTLELTHLVADRPELVERLKPKATMSTYPKERITPWTTRPPSCEASSKAW